MCANQNLQQPYNDNSRTTTLSWWPKLIIGTQTGKASAIGGGFVPEFFERVEKDQKVRNTRKLGEEVGHMCRWGFLGNKRERGAALMPRMSWNVSRTECVINRW